MSFDPSIIPNDQKLTVTLDHTPISTDQTDFPVTIYLDGSDPLVAPLFDNLGSNSKRMSFEVNDVQCPVEIQEWNIGGSGLFDRTEGDSYAQEPDAPYQEKAFDGVTSGANATDAWYCYVAPAYQPAGYVGKDYGDSNKKTVVGARLYTSNNTYDPKNFTIEGSQNGVDWDVLHTVTDQPKLLGWSPLYEFENTTAYRYIIVRVSENWGNATYLIIREIEFYVDEPSSAIINTKIPTYLSTESVVAKLGYDNTQADNSNVGEIGEILELDPILSGNVLGTSATYTDMAGSTQYNRRQAIYETSLGSGVGNKVRIKFLHGGTDYTLSSLYIGLSNKNNGGNGYDFIPNSSAQVTVGGNTSFTVTAGMYSDYIDLPMEIDGTEAVLIHYFNTNAIPRQNSMPSATMYTWYKSGADEGDLADASGYSAQSIWCVVEQIEAYQSNNTSARAVWSNGFNSVLHPQDPTGTVKESVTGKTLTMEGTMLSSALSVDGLRYDGTDDELWHVNDSDFQTTGQELTIEAVTQRHDSGWNDLVSFSSSSTTNYDLIFNTTGGVVFQWYNGAYITHNSMAAIPTDSEHYISLTYANGVSQFGIDGVLETASAGQAALVTSSSDELHYGKYPFDVGGYANITEREVRVSNVARSEDWLKLTYLSLTNQIATISSGTTPAVTLMSVLTQLYDLSVTQLLAVLTQPYKLNDRIMTTLYQGWGEIFTSILKQEYSDKELIQAILWQFYDSKKNPLAVLKQPYEDLDILLTTLKQPYDLKALLMAILLQRYKSVDKIPPAILKQTWTLHDKDSILATLKQQFSLLGDDDSIPPLEAYVAINGKMVDVISIDYDYDIDSYCGSFSWSLANYDDWLKLDYLDKVLIVINGVEHHSLITKFNSTESTTSNSYPVESRSQSVLLDFPYATAVPEDFNGVGTASELCQRLAQLEGLTINWGLNSDPPQTEDTVQLVGNSPLSGIRNLANELGGRVNSKPDGSIHIVKRFRVDTDKYDITVPDHTLTTLEDFIVVNTDTNKSYGYNKYVVSNTSTDTGYNLTTESISPSRVDVKATRVPWIDTEVILETSELTNVIIGPRILKEETLTETIEIKNGTGNVAEPCYGVVSYEYPDRINLGSVTITEDGIVTSQVSGTSMVDVTYVTRYWLWETSNTDSEEVQFILVSP